MHVHMLPSPLSITLQPDGERKQETEGRRLMNQWGPRVQQQSYLEEFQNYNHPSATLLPECLLWVRQCSEQQGQCHEPERQRLLPYKRPILTLLLDSKNVFPTRHLQHTPATLFFASQAIPSACSRSQKRGTLHSFLMTTNFQVMFQLQLVNIHIYEKTVLNE